MRVILDECLPRPLSALLTGHEVKTVRQMRWQGKENGELLALVARHFDVFITVDQSLPHQQNLKRVKLALLILKTRSNKLEDIVPHLPEILISLRQIKPGQVRRIPRGY
jgi:hypothetical protein